MVPYRNHLILSGTDIKSALAQLDILAFDAILFVVDKRDILLGSLTDGDIRRGFLKGLDFNDPVDQFIQRNPKFIIKGKFSLQEIIDFRSKSFKILPVVDDDRKILNVVNLRFLKSILPIDVVMMAGGKGQRLKPLTDTTPKPLLKVGDKPIIEHNIDHIASFGVCDFWISIGYLGQQIHDYLGDGSSKGIEINYIAESKPLGTVGSITLIPHFNHDYVLVMNSDILTNLDYEDFFLSFMEAEADFAVVTIPYEVSIPYAVLETKNGHVINLKEKPKYTYYSNGGIYLMKAEILKYIPKDQFYNTTDLMEALITKGYRVYSYPLRGYWLDIGKPEDYAKAQNEINHIKF